MTYNIQINHQQLEIIHSALQAQQQAIKLASNVPVQVREELDILVDLSNPNDPEIGPTPGDAINGWTL